MSKVNRPKAVFDRNDLEGSEVEYKIESSLDDDAPDTLADPEGSADRSQALERSDFPFWVYNDFDLSLTNAFGGKFSDGKEHLSPTSATIASVIKYCDVSPADAAALRKLRDVDQTEAILDGYRSILSATSNAFNVVSSVNNIAQSALVERGIAKYNYYSRLGRVDDTTQELSESLLKAQTKMLEAAAVASVWMEVNKQVRELAGWKEPKYSFDYEVRRSMQSRADWVERNYRKVKPAVATAADHQAFAIAC